VKTIFKKGLIVVCAAVLAVLVYFIVGVLLLADAQYRDINIKKLEDEARTLKLFTPAAVFSDKSAADDWISRFNKSDSELPYRITLISRNGQVVFDTDADSTVMENHMDRREFQIAVKEGMGSDSRRSATLGNDYFYTAVAIYDSNSEFTGILRLSLLVPAFFSRLLGSALPFIICGGFLIIGVAVGLFYFSRRLSRDAEIKLNLALEERTRELKEKTAEAEAEGRYREAILNSMFEGLITLDKNFNIIFANPKICSLFGFNVDINVKDLSLIQFSHSVELEQAARQVLETGQSAELFIKSFIGNKFPGNKFPENKILQHFQVFLAPLEQGVVMVLRDISRLVRLEQVRKDFAANVSHELRTPIQVIQGFAENILDSSLEDKDQVRYFTEIIRKNALGMENLTNDLLTLVSLEDEEAVRPPLENAAIFPLISEASGAVAIAARNKNITIDIDCSRDLSACVHSTLLVQALINLLDNAIKYSGKASASGQAASPFSIKVSAFIDGEELLIQVKDKGVGIPAEHMDRIFERFYRVDRSRSRDSSASETGGTGLGLSIVRHIALLHRGKVEAESHTGEGSVFTLRLPAVVKNGEA